MLRKALTALFLLLSPMAGAALAQEQPPAPPADSSPPAQSPDPTQTPDPSQAPMTPIPSPQTPMLPLRGHDCHHEPPVTS